MSLSSILGLPQLVIPSSLLILVIPKNRAADGVQLDRTPASLGSLVALRMRQLLYH